MAIPGHIHVISFPVRAVLASDASMNLGTGDVEWRLDVALDDWQIAGTNQVLLVRNNTVGDNRNWQIIANDGGTMWLQLANAAGSAVTNFNLSWTTGGLPADGERVQIRITLDSDNGSSQKVISMYSRRGASMQDLANNTAWTLEVQRTPDAGVQEFKAISEPVSFNGLGGPGFTGEMYRALMWKDLTQTTKVFDVDFNNPRVSGVDWDDAVLAHDHWTMEGTENTDWEWIPSDEVLGVPQNLIATAVSSTQINLEWDAVTEADAYDIERNGVVIEDKYTGGVTYPDTGLSPSTEYTYRVRAALEV